MPRSLPAILAAILALAAPARADAAEVTLYTTREPGLIKPVVEAYAAKTGTKVNTVFMQDGMAERLKAEGARSPADAMLVVDAGTLLDLAAQGLTQPVRSVALDAAIPPGLRDADGRWFALSMRARVVLVSAARAADVKSMTYEGLADPRWKGKVCIRAGQHPYNIGLLGAMIAKNGEAATSAYLTALKANLARRPGGGDRDVAKDIAAGICDIGVSNLYYMGLMLSGAGGAEQKAWGEAVRVVVPTFADGKGTHVNISGAAVAAHAPHRDEAVRLLEYLAGPEAQAAMAEANFETPVRAGAPMHATIAGVGAIKADPTPLAAIAGARAAASRIVDETGFDR